MSVTRPQICPEVFNITCVSGISTGSSHCTVFLNPVPSSRPPPPHSLYRPQAGGLPCEFSQKKTSPLRNSAQMELICVTGCQSSFKTVTGSPLSRDSVPSSCQHPQTATSVAGRCGRGLSLGGHGSRPLQRNCSPPFQCILTAHSAPGVVVCPWHSGVAG